MRKLLIILLSIATFLVLGSIVYIIIACCGLATGFYEVKFIDLSVLIANVLLSGMFVVVLAIITENDEKNNRKVDVMIKIIDKLLDIFENKLDLDIEKDRQKFWAYSLSAKRMIERDLETLIKKKTISKAVIDELNVLKEVEENYFRLIQDSFCENNELTPELLEKEKEGRDNIINHLMNCELLLC